MAWRRFGLATINESGIVMHDKHASNTRENMKALQYIWKVSFAFDTSGSVSFWIRFKVGYNNNADDIIVDV